MSYPEKSKLEAEKADRIAIHNEYDMLKGTINRIFVTDDMSELHDMHDCAIKQIDIIYEYHLARVRELQKLNGGN